MINLFQNSFKAYTNQYRKILTNFYPAFGNKGFEERNLTNNYINSLLETLNDKDAIAWFEASFKGREKIDGVVFSPKVKSVFFLEAKRIENHKVETKIKSINKDINRLLKAKKRSQLISKWKGQNVFEKQFIIYLADVWTEREDTSKIPEQWESKEIIKHKDNIVICEYFSFKGLPDNFSKKESINNYNLLIEVFEVFGE